MKRFSEPGEQFHPKRQKPSQEISLSALQYDQYTVAWICALPIEMAAARAMLDEIHECLFGHPDDTNNYTLGSIKRHNIVIACLPISQYGTNNAAIVATNIKRTFPGIRGALMVGIGGGVPSKRDIRLGDVVVGTRVMQYDLGKIMGDGKFERTATPRTHDTLLGTTVASLRSKHELGPSRIPSILRQKLGSYLEYTRPSVPDRLFHATYEHQPQTLNCGECDQSKLAVRNRRIPDILKIHYGAIASGNQVMKHGVSRDNVARELDVICFEMEAAGLMDIFPSLPIRGVCDNSDSHKIKEWQRYAAATAAAYAKELIEELPVTKEQEAVASNPDPPGAGKSTIMKFAYLNMKRKARQKHAVTASFFFNARGEYLERSTLGMYRSLLLQLLEGYPDLQTVLDDPENLPLVQDSCPCLNVLKDLFCNAVSSLGHRHFTCFVDALDECDEQQVRDLVDNFEDLTGKSTDRGISFRICFSSRHYPYIATRFGIRLTLEDQSGHAQDLETYIQSRLRIQDSALVEELQPQLLSKAAGVFMWVVLVVDILNKEYQRGGLALRRRLAEIPSDLSELFKDILTRDRENMEYLLLCIRWILFAKRPLQPDEFCHALWSGLSLKNLVDDQIPIITSPNSDSLKIFVISSSKGLAEITKSKLPTVQFIHESVRDFLIKDRGLHQIWPELESEWESSSHDTLKQCCNLYLNHPSVYASTSSLVSGPNSNRTEACIEFPFLEYASQHILYHANAAAEMFPQNGFLSSFRLSYWIKMNNLFERSKIREYSQDANLFYILADKGFSKLICARREEDHQVHVHGERYRYPLFAALANGNKDTVAALLNASSSINNSVDITEGFNHRKDLKVYKDQTPLTWAAQYGRLGILNLLPLTGLSIDQRDGKGMTPLIHASSNGHEAVARLLIDIGADVNTSDQSGWTPLIHASLKDHEAVARLLIDKGAYVNTSDQSGFTPLIHALLKDHKAVAKLLIDRGADINASDQNGRIPLMHASLNGHEAVARLLIDKGADVNINDRSGWTLLIHASSNGHEAVARLLIDKGADVNTKNQSGWTPLMYASSNGHKAVVRLLIDKGAS
ncbi:hypothetical protein N7507_001210 [Penicillium longicatenatum]|nr:hypothetical protein N7507_001210 [Penicillium longicatenatum]